MDRCGINTIKKSFTRQIGIRFLNYTYVKKLWTKITNKLLGLQPITGDFLRRPIVHIIPHTSIMIAVWRLLNICMFSVSITEVNLLLPCYTVIMIVFNTSAHACVAHHMWPEELLVLQLWRFINMPASYENDLNSSLHQSSWLSTEARWGDGEAKIRRK